MPDTAHDPQEGLRKIQVPYTLDVVSQATWRKNKGDIVEGSYQKKKKKKNQQSEKEGK